MSQSMKKFAFVRMKPFPIPNRILPEVLKEVFPEYEVEIIDLIAELRSRPSQMIANLTSMARAYAPQIIQRRMTRSEAFYATPYLFEHVKRLVRQRVDRSQFAFTFQIQSLVDASVPGVPHFVYTDHTHLARLDYPGFDRRKLRPQWWIDLERSIYHNAAMNFTRSSNISKSLMDQYGVPPEKVECVGIGSNLADLPNRLENDGYRNKNILFVGMDWERKGGPDLLTAFKQVLAAHPDARLTIVGSTPDLNGLPNCTALGRVPVQEVGRYYRQASIFCLPTRLEPFGVVFIEALQHRLPVVATNVGAIPDFVKPGQTGYMIEPGDVGSLARYLITLLDSPEQCQRFGEQGHRLAVSEYSWVRVGEKLCCSIQNFIPIAQPA